MFLLIWNLGLLLEIHLLKLFMIAIPDLIHPMNIQDNSETSWDKSHTTQQSHIWMCALQKASTSWSWVATNSNENGECAQREPSLAQTQHRGRHFRLNGSKVERKACKAVHMFPTLCFSATVHTWDPWQANVMPKEETSLILSCT